MVSGRVELVDAALHRAVGIILDEDQALGSDLRALDEVGQLVELLAAVVGAARHDDTADVGCLVEDGEAARALEVVHELHKLHAEAQVGLVAAEAAHGLVPGHPLQFRTLHASHLAEEHAGHLLKQLEHILLVHKRHLAVDLRKLRLAVGAQVLVAEALRYLEVAVEASHHEQLLERLRALRERVELPWVHARRHDKVACALGRGPDEDRRLHLDEVLLVEEVADQDGHAVAQFQIAAHRRTAQVEVAILHAQVVATIRIVLDGERRRERRAEHAELIDDDLDVARRYLVVLALAFVDDTLYLNAILASQLIGLFAKRRVDGLVECQLGDAVAVAQVNEGHSSHLAHALHPSCQRHLAACVLQTKLSTCVCSIHIYNRYN